MGISEKFGAWTELLDNFINNDIYLNIGVSALKQEKGGLNIMVGQVDNYGD